MKEFGIPEDRSRGFWDGTPLHCFDIFCQTKYSMDQIFLVMDTEVDPLSFDVSFKQFSLSQIFMNWSEKSKFLSTPGV